MLIIQLVLYKFFLMRELLGESELLLLLPFAKHELLIMKAARRACWVDVFKSYASRRQRTLQTPNSKEPK